MTKKVGILICSSKLYPSMMFDFMEGFCAYCANQNIPNDNFVIESIGHGGDYKLLQQKVESLLLRSDIAILVAFIDILAAERIEPFVNASGKTLISVDIGAHVPGLHLPSPHHIAISLQSGYGTALSVQGALNNGLKSFTFASSMLDAGYTHVYAAWRLIEKKQAKVNYHYTTPIVSTETNLDYLKAHTDQEPSDAMILQFCALGFNDFQRVYALNQLNLDIPVVAAPFLFERDWLSQQEILFTNCKGFVAWDNQLENSANREFKKKLLDYSGKEASIFHVLGWDTAIVTALVMSEINKPGTNSIKAVQQVVSNAIESPRGPMIWNNKFKRFVCPMYEATIVKKEEGYQPELTGVVLDNMEKWEEFAGDVPQQYSRWQNMYLCPT